MLVESCYSALEKGECEITISQFQIHYGLRLRWTGFLLCLNCLFPGFVSQIRQPIFSSSNWQTYEELVKLRKLHLLGFVKYSILKIHLPFSLRERWLYFKCFYFIIYMTALHVS